MFEYDQRVQGKRAKLLSAKRISLSGGGRRPDHPAHANRVAFNRIEVFGRVGSSRCAMGLASVAAALSWARELNPGEAIVSGMCKFRLTSVASE